MLYTRRDFGRVAAAALPAVAFAAPKINSKVDGVQLGAITYSFGGMPLDEVIKAYQDIGLGEMELMSNTAETAAGLPSPPQGQGRGGQGRGGAGRGPGGAGRAPGTPRAARPPMTEEQIAAARATPRAQEVLKWRTSQSMDVYKAMGKKIEAAGIDVAILCFNMNEAITDEEIDYAFQMAKALGADAISTSTQITVAKRVAPIAEKHKMRIGFHGHDNDTDPNETGSLESYAKALSFGKYNSVNLDIGHFTATNQDAVAFLKEHHARITNLHIKDRKKDHGPNVVWGEGDTPIKAVLQTLKKEKYKIPANIELEYPVPEGSDRVAEVKKCFAYMKQALA